MKKTVMVLWLAATLISAALAQVKNIEPPNKDMYSVQNGVQTVVINLKPRSYDAITVKKDLPVRFVIRAEARNINGCNNEVVIPQLKISKKIQPGDNIIEFTPTQAGVIPYSCWMNMIRSKITVVE